MCKAPLWKVVIAIIVKEKRRVCKSKDHMLSTNKKRPGTYRYPLLQKKRKNGDTVKNPRGERIVFQKNIKQKKAKKTGRQ